jgi:cytochrome oxidase Cu insertion factor (SCO1/SenC/PrrC family)
MSIRLRVAAAGLAVWLVAPPTIVSPQTVSSRVGTSDGAFTLDLPDVPVVDQDGRAMRFRTELLKDRTVAVNFVFTTCTTVCPALTTTMRAIQRDLGDRVGQDVWLISVSVDPTVDRPERLRAFANSFSAGPGWTFLTGEPADIERLLKAFGSAGGIDAHATTMLIGNARTGRWVRTSGLAPAATNVRLIVDAARTARADGF